MKLSKNQSFITHVCAIGGLSIAIAIPCSSMLIWAADKAIDNKFATDTDLRTVQQLIQTQIYSLKRSVDNNTISVQLTTASMDSLTLATLDLQISRIEDITHGFEQDKIKQGSSWQKIDERSLLDHHKTLKDLRLQRNVLFIRISQLSP